jgi:4-carboxymuconolactone decarboxylase
MSRIPYPPMESLSEVKKQRIFDPSRKVVLNVSLMALHASDALWKAQADLGRATIYEAELDRRLREMAIVRVAWLERSEYELFHHRAIAKTAGVTAEELAAIQGGDLAVLGPQERALMDFVSEVVDEVAPSDATVTAAREYFTDRLLFETVVIIGSYMMTARIAAVGGVELEDAPVTAW